MFSKEVYSHRRETLLGKLRTAGESGIVLFIGNAEAPAQYRDNCYKWRQDSSWLYYFGLDEPRYAAVLDIESGREVIYADDVDIDDIIWMGPQPSVQSLAGSVGVAHTAPYGKVDEDVAAARKAGRKVHYLTPSRYFNTLRLMELLGRARVDLGVSRPLTEAVISMRLVKEDIEIEAIDAACALGYEMHSVARDSIVPGIVEQDIVGKMEGVALSKGWGVSFPTILTQHGETLHNHIHDKVIEPGKLMVIDGGFSQAYHKTTGIAGYTLVYHSRGFQLVQHEPFTSEEDAVKRGIDIKSTTQIVEMTAQRMLVADTDIGTELKKQVADLRELLYAYRHGFIKEKR